MKCDRCNNTYSDNGLSRDKKYDVENFEEVYLSVNYPLCDTCFDDIIIQVAEGIKEGRV